MSLLADFLAANRRLSKVIEDRLPERFRYHLHTAYKYEVASLVNRQNGQIVLDIGCGRECPFVPFISNRDATLIIGVDHSPDELRHNSSLDCEIVADAAAAKFPLRDGAADLVVSRSVVEHLYDNAAFFENCARVLRPGGMMVHTFPCKFAPFALLNQLIPNWLTRRLLAYFHPVWKDDCGFRAYYDHCNYSSIVELLVRNGFENFKLDFRYYQSIYFDFFFPLYIIMLAYDLVIWRLGIRNLACGMVVTAVRSSDDRCENSLAVGGGLRAARNSLRRRYKRQAIKTIRVRSSVVTGMLSAYSDDNQLCRSRRL